MKPASTVTMIGDGAVGLLAVLSARQLGAEPIVLMGRHPQRTDIGRDFGATDVVADRGADGINQVRELIDGGSPVVLEAVGHMPAYEQAVGIVRPGGVISRVGVPPPGLPTQALDPIEMGRSAHSAEPVWALLRWGCSREGSSLDSKASRRSRCRSLLERRELTRLTNWSVLIAHQ